MNNQDFVTESYITTNWGGGTGSPQFLTKSRAIELGADPSYLTSYGDNQLITFGDLVRLQTDVVPPTPVPPLILYHTYECLLKVGHWTYMGQNRLGWYTGQGGGHTKISGDWSGIVEVHMVVDDGGNGTYTGGQLQMTGWDNASIYTAVVEYTTSTGERHWMRFKQKTAYNRWIYPLDTEFDGTVESNFNRWYEFFEKYVGQNITVKIWWYA